MKCNVFFLLLWLTLSTLSAQTLVKNKSFLVAIQAQYPQLIVNDSFLSADVAKVKKLSLPGHSLSLRDVEAPSWIKIIEGEVDLQAFSNLDTLAISGHQIKNLINIPASLKTINCSGNQLKTLDIEKVTNLKVLNCSYNELEKITFYPKKQFSLIIINCSHNQLKTLNLQQLASTYSLNCGYNPLVEFPSLQNVDGLDCSGIDLNQFPGWGDSLSSKLTHLKVNYCQLTTLPKLHKWLDVLHCEGNKLTELSNRLPSKLGDLNCSHNLLTRLPNDLPWYLTYLNCSHNQIDSLPEFLPRNMIALDCSHNKIVHLPELLPLKLYNLNCSYNAIKELIYLPCKINTINANSNLIQTIGDLPPSVNDLSFKDNPVFDSIALARKGWYKTKNNQWDKPRTEYNCGLNYAIRMNCDTCLKGYRLTKAAQNIEKLELNNLKGLLDVQIDTLDLTIFPKLKVLSAKENIFKKIILPASIQVVDVSQNYNLTSITGWGDSISYLKTEHIRGITYPNSLKYLIINENNIAPPDTIKKIPSQLKHFEIKTNMFFAKTAKLPASLEYFNLLVSDWSDNSARLLNQPLPNLKRLDIDTYKDRLPTQLKKLTSLTILNIKAPELTLLDNLPPNLERLDILAAKFSRYRHFVFPKTLRSFSCKSCDLHSLSIVEGEGLESIDFYNSNLQRLLTFETPALITLSLSSNPITKLPNQWPATLKELDINRTDLTEKELLALPCSYWQQFETVNLSLKFPFIKQFEEQNACTQNTKFHFNK